MDRPYFLEKSLPVRVSNYMDDNDDVDLEEMTESLIQNYKEYRKKNAKVFIKSVRKAYDWEVHCRRNESMICDTSDIEIEDDDNGGPDIVEVTQKKTPSKRIEQNGFLTPLEIKKKSLHDVSASSMNGKSKHHTSFSDDTPSKRLKRELISTQTSSRTSKLKAEIPTTCLNDLKGLEGIKYNCTKLFRSLYFKDIFREVLCRSAVISGPEGSGKTSLIEAIASAAKAKLLRISSMKMSESGEGQKQIKDAFNYAIESAPCILLFDKLPWMSQKTGNVNRSQDRTLCLDLIERIKNLKKENTNIVVVAEISHFDDIDFNLRSCFDEEISMPIPKEKARGMILQSMCPDVSFDMSELARRTPGFVAGDMEKLVKHAKERAMERASLSCQPKEEMSPLDEMISSTKALEELGESGVKVTLEDFMDVLPTIVPALKKQGFPCIPDITMVDVGGVLEPKSELQDKVLDIIKFPEVHKDFGIRRSNGILMWGPPGCGKTLLAQAMANEAGINFLAVRGPEILSMYQGESERKIREIFLRAKSVSPCIVFFDEFEGICPERTRGSESGSRTTIVGTLLAEMNGFTARDEVYILGATNRPDMVDPAVLRPGRFDSLLYVGMPDHASRVSILKAISKNGTSPKFGPDVNLLDITKKLEGFSGADLSNLLFLASKAAVKNKLYGNNTDEGACERGTVYKRHFEHALQKISPSVPASQMKKYLKMKARYEVYNPGEGTPFQDDSEQKPRDESMEEALPTETDNCTPVYVGS